MPSDFDPNTYISRAAILAIIFAFVLGVNLGLVL